jgi:ATP-dependent Clp protease ATP-binding subunit ClpA
MFERFTESARQVIVQAQHEARTLGHGHIGTEHILLGLLLEGEGVAAWALAKFDVTADAVRAEVARSGEAKDPGGGQMPFTPRAKQLLELALREALGLAHNYIGTEHVLLAVLAAEESGAARILGEFAQPEDVRKEVLRRLGEDRRQPPPRDFPAMPWRRVPGSMASWSGEWDVDFAELAALSDEDLDALIDRLVDDENRLLYKQGALQGQLEILRAQRNHRRRRQAGGGSSPDSG